MHEFVNNAATSHEFFVDTRGHYIIPPQQLMPLYGLWDGKSWIVSERGELLASTDKRLVDAYKNSWYCIERKVETREIGPGGLPVEAEA